MSAVGLVGGVVAAGMLNGAYGHVGPAGVERARPSGARVRGGGVARAGLDRGASPAR
ncbi:hypothetical protein GCM10023324_04320 [Streptomyces youssoufiensis]